MSTAPSLVVLCGPTASGKTSLALRLAELFPCEIVSADSRQVYREMNIGTAKPSRTELNRVPHHLIDVVNPDQPFTASDYAQLGHAAVASIVRRRRLPLVVGGTGLYLQVLTSGLLDIPGADEPLRENLRRLEEIEGVGSLHRRLALVDPAMACRLQPRDQVRIIRALEVQALTGQTLSSLQQRHRFSDARYRVLWLGVEMDRAELYRIIDLRVEQMFADGLVEEVSDLLERGYPADLKAFKTIGYREVIQLLDGNLSLPAAIAAVKLHSRRYAKRQMTWFRKNPDILWVDSCREFAKITELMKCHHA